MGFAALETMGYAFVTLLKTNNLAALDEILLIRGLLSPTGHAAWTGFVAAVIWRERLLAGHAVLNLKIVRAFIVAVVLHALWDTFNSAKITNIVQFISLESLSLLVAITSLMLLILKVREASRTPA